MDILSERRLVLLQLLASMTTQFQLSLIIISSAYRLLKEVGILCLVALRTEVLHGGSVLLSY